MAEKVLSPEEWKAIEDANRAPAPTTAEKVKTIVRTIPTRATNFTESLMMLFISVIYFTFSGMAILMKRPMPKYWRDLAKDLGGDKITEPIKKKIKEKKLVKKAGKFRVVDLETNKRIL